MTKLRRIPSIWDYGEFKQNISEDIEWYEENGLYDPEDEDLQNISFMQFIWLEQYDTFIQEGGLTRLYMHLASIIHEIEQGEVDQRDAHFAFMDLEDFMTGNFDDLVKPHEREEVKADVKRVHDYIVAHNLK